MWHRMQQMRAEGHTVRVKVASANRGGLLVQYGVFDGFLPVGQFGPVSCASKGQVGALKMTTASHQQHTALHLRMYCAPQP
jgi:ribosomal protein S1